ncbi:phosphotransferase family protein [Meridianimarinicoccus sp. RP-17]
MCRDRSRPPPPPVAGPALRRRLAARLGARAGDGPVRLTGGRSAAAVRLGRGADAVVVKISRAPGGAGRVSAPVGPAERDTGRAFSPAAPRTPGDRPRPAPRDDGHDAHGVNGIGGALFPVDPLLEIRVMAALARRGLAARPAAAFRHGPDICLAYPFQAGRAGQPPGPALARLLRRLHTLPPAALPHLPGPPDGRAALLARARDRLQREPDGRALGDCIAAAADAARCPPPGGARPLHGDPVPGNVVHGAHGPRLIDWHSAHRGDPCHDLALALSPAMQVIHGLPPRTPSQRRAFLAAYGCPATTARLDATAALHHGLMIGHCLWRQERGDRAYGPAHDAEITALRALPPA